MKTRKEQIAELNGWKDEINRALGEKYRPINPVASCFMTQRGQPNIIESHVNITTPCSVDVREQLSSQLVKIRLIQGLRRVADAAQEYAETLESLT